MKTHWWCNRMETALLERHVIFSYDTEDQRFQNLTLEVDISMEQPISINLAVVSIVRMELFMISEK